MQLSGRNVEETARSVVSGFNPTSVASRIHAASHADSRALPRPVDPSSRERAVESKNFSWWADASYPSHPSNASRSVTVHPGTISWHELRSASPYASAQFIAASLDDECITRARGHSSEYSTILCKGLHVAGARRTERDAAPSWVTFIRVPDVDLIADMALQLGGRVDVAPLGIRGLDRRAVISDPTGASITAIAGGDDRRTVGTGTFGWDELRSTQPTESLRFWCALFDWSARPVLKHSDSQTIIFLNGGKPVATLAPTLPSEPRSRWLPVATVRSDLVEPTLHHALLAGASIRVAPRAHSVLTTLAVVVDPMGLEFAIGAEPVEQVAAA